MYLKRVSAWVKTWMKLWRIVDHFYWIENLHTGRKNGAEGEKIFVLGSVEPGRDKKGFVV